MPLLDDTFEDVMVALARAVGGKKAFAEILRPELEDQPDRARRWLIDALNPDHQQNMHVDHVVRALRAGREAGCHLLIAWLCREAGYEVPRPAAQPSRRTQLLAEDARLAKERERVSQELDRIESADTVRTISRLGRA